MKSLFCTILYLYMLDAVPNYLCGHTTGAALPAWRNMN